MLFLVFNQIIHKKTKKTNYSPPFSVGVVRFQQKSGEDPGPGRQEHMTEEMTDKNDRRHDRRNDRSNDRRDAR